MGYKSSTKFPKQAKLVIFFFFLKIFTRKATPALNFNKQLEVKSDHS